MYQRNRNYGIRIGSRTALLHHRVGKWSIDAMTILRWYKLRLSDALSHFRCRGIALSLWRRRTIALSGFFSNALFEEKGDRVTL